MKSLLYLLITCAISIGSGIESFAQNYSRNQKRFEAGHLEVGAGIGLISTFATKYIYTKNPPLNFHASYRLKRHFSVGIHLAETSMMFISDLPISPVIPRQIESDLFLIGVRASGHYNMEDFDFYGGAMIGYIDSHILTDIEKRKLKENTRTKNMVKKDVIFSGHMGIQFLINHHLGMFSEFGFGLALLKFGVIYKI